MTYRMVSEYLFVLGDQARQVVNLANLLVELVQLALQFLIVLLYLVVLFGQDVICLFLVVVGLLDDLLQDHLVTLEAHDLLVEFVDLSIAVALYFRSHLCLGYEIQ